MDDWYKYYEYYGVCVHNPERDESLIECPYCEEDKAYLSKTKGTYDCKLCGESGNQYTFVRNILSNATENKLIHRFAELKNFDVEFLREWDVFEHLGEVYVPVRNKEGKVVSARSYNFQENALFNPPGFRKPNFWKWSQDIERTLLFEADFDALAYLKQCDMDGKPTFNVVSFPGANMSDSWVKHFKEKEVVCCFDFDVLKGKKPNQFYPGEKATVAAFDKLQSVVKTFKWLNWESYGAIKRPFDVRDLHIACRNNRMDFWDVFDVCEEAMVKIDAPDEPQSTSIESIEVKSFEELCKRYAEVIDVTETFKKCLACSIATIISAKTKDLNALWMFLVGPSSSGKSTILSAFNGCTTQSIHRSSITKTALVSGRASDTGNDPSILPRLKNKCLIIKDLTMLLSSNTAEQEAVFGTLRDAYDQDLSLSYGNGQVRDYGDLNFSWLAGVTEVIHTFNRADVGERFLKIDIVDPAVNEFESIKRAISNKDTKGSYDYLKKITKGFVNHIWDGDYEDPDNLPEIPADQLQTITCAALVISYLRTKIKIERDGTIDFRFRKEFGHRVAIQLGKLVRFLCIVFQKESLTDEEMKNYVLKVTLDTCTSIKTELIWWLMKRFKQYGGAMAIELEGDAGLSRQTIDKHLNSMIETNILKAKNRTNGKPGRPDKIYYPTDEFLTIWQGAGFHTFNYEMRKQAKVVINRKPLRRTDGKSMQD